MRIKHMQTGGIAPFMTYTPGVAMADTSQPAQVQAAALQEAKEKEGLLTKDMMKMIMDDGVPSDVEAFLDVVKKFQSRINAGGSAIDMNQMYLRLLPYLNKIKYNKDDLSKTKDELTSRGAMAEPAISQGGYMYIYGEDGLEKIHISEYDPKEQYAVSNGELLNQRAYNKSLAYDNQISLVLKNGQSPLNVTKQMLEIINNIKVQKEKQEGFLPAELAKVLEAIEGAKGIVKQTVSTETSRKHLKEAMNYMLTMLPNESKYLLEIKAKQTGTTIDQVMLQLIVPSTQENLDVSYDYKPPTEKKESGSGGSAGKRDISWLESFVGNALSKDGLTEYELNPGGRYSIFAPALLFNTIVDAVNGKQLDRNASIGTIVKDGFGGVGDVGNIYFGDQKVPPEYLDNIAATGQRMSKAYMPIDLDYQSQTGGIRPDLEVQNRLEKADNEIKKNPQMTEAEKMQVYEKYRVSQYIHADISDTRLFAAFAVIPSWAQGSRIDLDSDSPYILKIEKTDEIEYILNKAKFGLDEDGDPKQDYLAGFWGSLIGRGKMYEGLCFIHVVDDMVAAAQSGNNLTVPKDLGDYDVVMRNSKLNESKVRANNIQTNNSNLLDE